MPQIFKFEVDSFRKKISYDYLEERLLAYKKSVIKRRKRNVLVTNNWLEQNGQYSVAEEFIFHTDEYPYQNINIEEIPVEKLYDVSNVKTILELDLRKKTGCNVIGYKDSNGEYHINPDATQKLTPDSKIIVLGKSEQIQNLNSIYNIDF